MSKVCDVVSPCMRPPEHALVLAVDKKSQLQALDRTAPCPPIQATTLERRTNDYVRHGTTSLFAGYDLAAGSVIAQHDLREIFDPALERQDLEQTRPLRARPAIAIVLIVQTCRVLLVRRRADDGAMRAFRWQG